MFFRKFFVYTEDHQVMFEASVSKCYLSYSGINLAKLNILQIFCRRLFSRGGDCKDREILYLKAHLIDLLELNCELFDKRVLQYHHALDVHERARDFLFSDLETYRSRKERLVKDFHQKILVAGSMKALLEIKAYLISNVFLLSYKVKVPYLF